ncbi:MAG: hypothetical protein ACFB6R_02875 [Alphaproteobacteria bacterium]
MDTSLASIMMFVGFMFAAYSIVANDAIQTLGTFLSSNSHRPWWLLWLYASTILTGVLVYGWFVNYGDVAYGRLAKFPEPEGGVTWIHVIPPIFILLLTRFGIPVSTTFLVLTVFAPTNTQAVLMKSVLGYGVAIGVGLLVYLAVSRLLEKRFMESAGDKPGWYWVVFQWASTGFLWSQWLIQDLANIFVYLPRELDASVLVFSVVFMLLLHAIIFARRGGEIQKIVTSKTNTTDIRAATIIDLIYAFILLYFKQISNIPMSTTWVFLGLLAGREIALTLMVQHRPIFQSVKMAVQDLARALLGLAVSFALAFGLPALDRMLFTRAASVDGSNTRDVEDGSAAGEPPAAQDEAAIAPPAMDLVRQPVRDIDL